MRHKQIAWGNHTTAKHTACGCFFFKGMCIIVVILLNMQISSGSQTESIKLLDINKWIGFLFRIRRMLFSDA